MREYALKTLYLTERRLNDYLNPFILNFLEKATCLFQKTYEKVGKSVFKNYSLRI